jgi:hypothetical protein
MRLLASAIGTRSIGGMSPLTVAACPHARREIADHARPGIRAGPAREVTDRAGGGRGRSGHAGRERSCGSSVVRTRAKPSREIAWVHRRSRPDGIGLNSWRDGRLGWRHQRLVTMHRETSRGRRDIRLPISLAGLANKSTYTRDDRCRNDRCRSAAGGTGAEATNALSRGLSVRAGLLGGVRGVC